MYHVTTKELTDNSFAIFSFGGTATVAAVDDVAVELFNSATWSCRLLSAARILSWQEVASDPDPARAGDPSKIQYILDVHHMYIMNYQREVESGDDE